jgi:hypothetical protein
MLPHALNIHDWQNWHSEACCHNQRIKNAVNDGDVSRPHLVGKMSELALETADGMRTLRAQSFAHDFWYCNLRAKLRKQFLRQKRACFDRFFLCKAPKNLEMRIPLSLRDKMEFL